MSHYFSPQVNWTVQWLENLAAFPAKTGLWFFPRLSFITFTCSLKSISFRFTQGVVFGVIAGSKK